MRAPDFRRVGPRERPGPAGTVEPGVSPSITSSNPTAAVRQCERRGGLARGAGLAGDRTEKFRRAGVLKKSARTAMVVPRWRTAGATASSRLPVTVISVGVGSVGGEHRESGHRRDGGQRFATEPEGAHAHQIRGVDDLAGGVAVERQDGVVAAHARAIVAHQDERLASLLRSTRTFRAPASMAFSTSSFTTEAGRSTTSPAAI